MPKIFKDFYAYLLAVWTEWKVLLTGGSIIALLWLFGLFGGKQPPANVNWLVFGLTLILASFLAWRKEREKEPMQVVQLVAEAQKAQEEYITLSPRELVTLIDDKTTVHANALIKPYLGKRIRVSGRMRNLSPSPYLNNVHLISADNVPLNLRVPNEIFSDLLPLHIGDEIDATGRLDDCHPLLGLTVIEVSIVSLRSGRQQSIGDGTSTHESD